MAGHKHLYDQIRALRSKGMTYREINEQLGTTIPKNSLSHICKDVILPGFYSAKIRKLEIININLQRKKALLANKRILEKRISVLRQTALQKLKGEYKKYFVALAMLYLGEGGKRGQLPGSRGLSLGSSDPLIIQSYISLLKICYEKKTSDLRARVLYRADQNITELEKYWSKVAGLKRNQFYKTKFDPRTVGKPTLKVDYRGVCVIFCSGADIQLELQFIAEHLAKEINSLTALRDPKSVGAVV